MLRPLILLLFTFNSFAQTCLDNVEESAPTSNFVIQADGTATDFTTGLMWMRCSLGQVWQSGDCLGDATQFTWQQALQASHGFMFAELAGWRVPNIKELATIGERACVRPSIQPDLFPNTQSDDYWTSTPSVNDPSRAWVVAFFNTSNAIKDKDLFVFVRLVRNAD